MYVLFSLTRAFLLSFIQTLQSPRLPKHNPISFLSDNPINMASTIPLQVAIYDNPRIKRWSLFIEAKDDARKAKIHIFGVRHNYFLEVRTPSDTRGSAEVCPLCQIDESEIRAVEDVAYDTPIFNDKSDYSCQDFVLDVLARLEDKGLVDADSSDYKTNKDAVQAKRESWQ